jgi:hypothetical protein
MGIYCLELGATNGNPSEVISWVNMKFNCTLPDRHGTVIEFKRNPFFGSVSIKANSQVIYSRSAFNLLNHFEFSLTRGVLA